ncbi:MAG: hypothetical protein A2X05_00245 [Bacteroidetes bacterium GWE2_41_25]|nr:MAG: hypothetical protein A2X03_01895 [Bacteroidetes bacterium GWA2_40_15]OFX85853.1 MAG: hypothetical protein A2X06_11080 [Bacteroidetes bacterium GWC2_40_22]OFX97436.1 MAG: hypothetical protein A2X05_00245 [Bacteroidetes bacterium GWE2_41_25]OFY58669.1 MAG: hypothetical protein A2X04_01025 [Bacteroidetes bacterium GWF2_41_9]HAM09438.1 hypothetical protein [Bacteroidales bacterium]
MGINSTPFISYHEIDVENIDLIDDAWGFNSEFHDVLTLLRMFRIEPGERLTNKLIDKIRSDDR